MKPNTYYSAVIVFMMSASILTVTLDKSIVEKFISPLTPHGASSPTNKGIVRSFNMTSTEPLWRVALCDSASQIIDGVSISELDAMSSEELSRFVNNANKHC